MNGSNKAAPEASLKIVNEIGLFAGSDKANRQKIEFAAKATIVNAVRRKSLNFILLFDRNCSPSASTILSSIGKIFDATVVDGFNLFGFVWIVSPPAKQCHDWSRKCNLSTRH